MEGRSPHNVVEECTSPADRQPTASGQFSLRASLSTTDPACFAVRIPEQAPCESARARTLHSPINSHLRRVMFMVDNTRRLLRRSVMSLSLLTNRARLRSLCSAPHPSQRPLAEEVTRTRTSCTLQSGIASPFSSRRCLEFTLFRSSSARAALFAPQSSGHQRGEPYRSRRILK